MVPQTSRARAGLFGCVLLLAGALACGRDQSGRTGGSRDVRPAALGTPSAGYDFAYDPAGRLVEVIAPTGEAARYVYDPAGNIIAIERYPAGGLSILSFSPPQGSPGQLVTVTGIGFSSVPSENIVQLNGLALTVTGGNSAQLTFTVPPEATTGRISVSIAGSTATSAADFVVTASPVAISDFSPRIGKAGNAISITGQGFESDPLSNNVTILTIPQLVTTASATTLQAVVSQRTASGRIGVQTPQGNATSTEPFIVLPSSFASTNILSTASSPLGSTTSLTFPTGGKSALLYFDGSAGQGITLYMSGVTIAGTTTIQVFTPAAVFLASGSVTAGATTKFDLGVLPMTGTYSIFVTPPTTSSGTINVQVLSDATGVLQVDGPSLSSVVGIGQNGRYTFSGTAGDLLGLGVPQLSTTPTNTVVTFQVLKPDGSSHSSCGNSRPLSCQVPVLPVSGAYTVRVMPSGTAAANIALLVSRPLTGTLVADGSLIRFQSSRAGQTGRYTFTATAGQNLSLQATISAGFPNYLYVNIYKPDGSQLTYNYWSSASDSKIDLSNLPATGTYLVQVLPQATDTGGTVDLHLWPDAVATLQIAGSSAPLSMSTGQNGRYTFAGTAADLLTLGISQLAFTPSGGSASFSVLKPDGTSLTSCSMSAAGNCVVASLPVSGTYTVRVVPSGTVAATDTAQLTRR